MLATTKTDYIYKDACSQFSIKIVRARHKLSTYRPFNKYKFTTKTIPSVHL